MTELEYVETQMEKEVSDYLKHHDSPACACVDNEFQTYTCYGCAHHLEMIEMYRQSVKELKGGSNE